MDKVNEQYDPTKKAKGSGNIITRCSITDVTPQMIAYAAVQVLIYYHLAHTLTALTRTPSIDIHRAFIHEGMGYSRWQL